MANISPTDPVHAINSAESVSQARPAAKSAPTRPVVQKPVEQAQPQHVAPHVSEETNVVFRRDNNGQIYYVFTDQSGRELQELPPKEVRNVGQHIADLVKELQEKSSNHIEVKA